MKVEKQMTIKEIRNKINSNIYLKTAFYIGAGVVSIYLIGRVLSVLAGAIRGYKDLKSAIKD